MTKHILPVFLLLFSSMNFCNTGNAFNTGEKQYQVQGGSSLLQTELPEKEEADMEEGEEIPVDTLLLKACLHKAMEIRDDLIKELKKASPDEAYAIYTSHKYRFDYAPEFDKIDSLLGESMLLRWYNYRSKKENRVYYETFDENFNAGIPPLKNNDPEIIEMLENAGLDVDSSEGMSYLTLSATAYYATFEPYFDDETREFAGPEVRYPRIVEDAALFATCEQLLDRCILLEKFLEKYPESRFRKEALSIYKYYMSNILFCTYDNTPTFEYSYDHNSYNKIDPAKLKEIEALPGRYPDSQADAIIREYLKDLKANNYKYHEAFEKKIMSLGLLGEAETD